MLYKVSNLFTSQCATFVVTFPFNIFQGGFHASTGESLGEGITRLGQLLSGQVRVKWGTLAVA